MNTEIKIFKYGSPEYQKTVDLRYKILRVPLGLTFSEADLKKDENDFHFGLLAGGVLVACLILTPEANGKVKMRQVAVDDTVQGKGYGAKLSLAAEDWARNNGYNIVYCHARSVAAGFYKKLGYTIIGDEFTEVGIAHYMMEKKL